MKELTKYDSQNRPIEVTWIDDDGNPTVNQYGVASIQSTFLSYDNLYSRVERFYDLTGNPIEDKLGVHMIRRIWDPIRRMETETYHNLQAELVEVLYGFCEVHYCHGEDNELNSYIVITVFGKPLGSVVVYC